MPSRSNTILLVDDDQEDRELLTEALLALAPATRVQNAIDGVKALAYLHNCPSEELPCIIVLDYNMPRLSGEEVLNRLCAETRYSSIPIIVWSTSSAQRYRTDCLNKGASDYFVKPDQMEGYPVIARQILDKCTEAG